MTRNTKYTIALGKGCGLIEETLTLLSVCDEHTTKDSLAKYVHEQNLLSKCSDMRSMDIVKRVFYPRFMQQNPQVVLWLSEIRKKGLLLSQFKQLLMLYCVRENAVVYDFIVNELNVLRTSLVQKVELQQIAVFVKNIVDEGKAKWGESVQKKQTSSIKTVLADFDMIARNGNILPYEISSFTLLYLMHELHFAGLSDMAIWNHEDWQLFGLDKYTLRDRIMDMNIKGGYIAQCSGELLTISWNYQTMEEFIDATL